MPIDIYRAKAHHFQIIDGKLMPALSTIEGLGDKAADQLEAAAKDGPFLSRDDLRTTKQAVKDRHRLHGRLRACSATCRSPISYRLFDYVS